MSLDTDIIRSMLGEALQILTESAGAALACQIKPILLANLDRGRVQTFLDGDPDRLQEYVRCVAENFVSHHAYLHALQSERNQEVWEPLYERMQTWAYNYFLRKNFAADQNTLDIAAECASEAAVTLLGAHFPYDTEFDPWAHTLVQNACRKYIQRNLKKSLIPETQKVELDEELIDPSLSLLEINTLQKEFGAELSQALDQLTEARRTVLQLLFFEEISPSEVAEKLDKSVGAVYTLQFHALEDLRKILSANRDNLNE